MGFNKRFVNREAIVGKYSQGLEKLIHYITDTDCLIIQDVFSEKVVDSILNDDAYIADEKIKQLLEQ
jgi:hypothetical protein